MKLKLGWRITNQSALFLITCKMPYNGRLHFADFGNCLVRSRKIRKRTTAPDTKRTLVNPAASIPPIPRANRHSTELAAKATRAQTVTRKTFAIILWEGTFTRSNFESEVMCNLVVIFAKVLSRRDLAHPKNRNPRKIKG